MSPIAAPGAAATTYSEVSPIPRNSRGLSPLDSPRSDDDEGYGARTAFADVPLAARGVEDCDGCGVPEGRPSQGRKKHGSLQTPPSINELNAETAFPPVKRRSTDASVEYLQRDTLLEDSSEDVRSSASKSRQAAAFGHAASRDQDVGIESHGTGRVASRDITLMAPHGVPVNVRGQQTNMIGVPINSRSTWRATKGTEASVSKVTRAIHDSSSKAQKPAHSIKQLSLNKKKEDKDEKKTADKPKETTRRGKPRDHTIMLKSEAGKAAQTTELLFRARCREIFNNIDADHSGNIDMDELGVAMKLLGRAMETEALEKMMATHDVDGDGQLDMNEFVQLMSDKEKERSEAAANVLQQRAAEMARQGKMAQLSKRMVQTDGIVLPDAMPIQLWDVMVLLIILVLFPLLPLMLAFPRISHSVKSFDSYCDIVFVIDIVKNFHVGYVDSNDVLHMDRREIARNYLSGWFWPDVASVMSVIKFVDFGSGDAFLSILKMLKLFKLFRTARLLDHLAPFWYKVQDYYHFHISDAWIKLSKLFFFLLVLAHWMGCLSFALARFWSFPRGSWVVVAGLVSNEGKALKPISQQYSWCLCRALALIVMESYNTPYATGMCVDTDGWCTIETWTTLLCLYIGSIFYAALISNISAIVGDMNVSKRRFEEQVQTTDEYMITKNIPRHLRERVREFYHLRYAKGRIFNEHDILDSLNAELRTEIASYNTRAVVAVVPLLNNSPLRFTRAMTVDMMPTIYFARDLVVQEGNSGDDMFFISNGMAEILLRACGNVAIHVISDGCYFGEVAVLFGSKRTASIRTLSVSVMYGLSGKSLLAAIADFPEIEAYLQRIASGRRTFLKKLGQAFADDEPLPEPDDPEDKQTVMYNMGMSEHSNRKPKHQLRQTGAFTAAVTDLFQASDGSPKRASAALRASGKKVSPGSPSSAAGSPSHDRNHMLHGLPPSFNAIKEESSRSLAAELSCSAAAILDSTSQERARKLHDKQVRLLQPVAEKRATMIQSMGNRNGQRYTVRQFARKTGQI